MAQYSRGPSDVLVVRLILFFTSSLSMYSAVAKKHYNVLDFGAKSDGETDSTGALVAAWDVACGSGEHTTVYVPPGRFLVGSAAFRGSQCKGNGIKFHLEGTLVAPSDHWATGDARNWLLFENVNNLKIHGGVVDGRGSGLWNCKASGRKDCPIGARSLSLVGSTNVVVNGLTLVDSQSFHVLIKDSHNVKMIGVTVSAAGDSPNTDGIHVQTSSSVTILNSSIGTGDDCISVGPGTTNLWIDRVNCGPGHGISVGSLGWSMEEDGVVNVAVKSVTFTNTQNGVRIKTWGRPSRGFARRIHFRHAIMSNVQNPIFIDQNYCPALFPECPAQASGVKISDVTYDDIHGTSATQVAVRFECSKTEPCSRIKLKDIKLTFGVQPAAASCTNADGKAFGIVQPSSCL